MIKKLISLALCLAIIALSALVVGVVSAAKPSKSQQGAKEKKAANVRLRQLEYTTIDDVLLLTGRIDPWEEVELSAEVPGNVEWQGIDEGQCVKRGQELIRIDTIWFEATNRQAIANQTLAQQELERMESLRKSGVSSPQELDRAQTQFTVASADLAASETQLGKTVIRAPFDGTVDRVVKEVGEWAPKGESLVRLVQTAKMKAIVGVPERDIVFFEEGDEVAIRFEALPDQSFTGKIFRIATSAERSTRTFETEIQLDNPDGTFKPGMTIRASFVRESYPDAIAVPIFSIISVENQRFAAVAEDGLAQFREVKIGVLQGHEVQITEGLDAGDQLIVVGHRDLRPGDPVKAVTEASE